MAIALPILFYGLVYFNIILCKASVYSIAARRWQRMSVWGRTRNNDIGSFPGHHRCSPARFRSSTRFSIIYNFLDRTLGPIYNRYFLHIIYLDRRTIFFSDVHFFFFNEFLYFLEIRDAPPNWNTYLRASVYILLYIYHAHMGLKRFYIIYYIEYLFSLGLIYSI